MKDNGMSTTRRGTGRSALGLVALAILVVALMALIAWAFTRPGFLESVVNLVAVVVVALIIIAAIACIAYAVLAVGYYATKGDVVQTGVDHSLEDVKGVDGRTLDDDGEDAEQPRRGRCRPEGIPLLTARREPAR